MINVLLSVQTIYKWLISWKMCQFAILGYCLIIGHTQSFLEHLLANILHTEKYFCNSVHVEKHGQRDNTTTNSLE